MTFTYICLVQKKLHTNNHFFVSCRAAFKFDESNQLVVGGTGDQFDQFKACFGPDDRGFGYIKIQVANKRFMLEISKV